MKDRYPYLSYWNETGFQEFPGIPPSELVKPCVQIVRESLRKRLAKNLHTRFFLTKEDLERREAELMDVFEPEIMEMIAERFQEIMAQHMLEEGYRTFEAKKAVINGQDRETALREWGKDQLPSTQGGESLFTTNRKLILKKVHQELQDCIKEVRRNSGIPLRNDHDYVWGINGADPPGESELIKSNVPDWQTIFDNSELPLLTYYSSVSRVSLEIICKRLTRCLPHRIKPKTLQNQLNTLKST